MGLGNIDDFGGSQNSEEFKYANAALPNQVLVEDYYKEYIDIASRSNYDNHNEHYSRNERKIIADLIERMTRLMKIEGKSESTIKEYLVCANH